MTSAHRAFSSCSFASMLSIKSASKPGSESGLSSALTHIAHDEDPLVGTFASAQADSPPQSVKRHPYDRQVESFPESVSTCVHRNKIISRADVFGSQLDLNQLSASMAPLDAHTLAPHVVARDDDFGTPCSSSRWDKAHIKSTAKEEPARRSVRQLQQRKRGGEPLWQRLQKPSSKAVRARSTNHLGERRVAFNRALLAKEPRRRWAANGTRAISIGDTHAEQLHQFLREHRNQSGEFEVKGRVYTGYYNYRATHISESRRAHNASEQKRNTLIIDDLEHARKHFPGLDLLINTARSHLPEPADILHCHVLDQTSGHTKFSDHQDSEENRRKGEKQADREVLYTVVLKLNRDGATAMRVLGHEQVVYGSSPGSGVCFLSELWHRTEVATPGTMKLTLFFGRWL